MDAFFNTNKSKSKDLRGWNSRRSAEQNVVITFSGIPLSQIFVSKVVCIQKSVHHDVVGMLVTSESSWSIPRAFIILLYNRWRFIKIKSYTTRSDSNDISAHLHWWLECVPPLFYHIAVEKEYGKFFFNKYSTKKKLYIGAEKSFLLFLS